MQFPTHILLSYAVCSAIIPEANSYLIPLVISAIFLDLDHIPAYLINKKNNNVSGALWRTRLHELYGVMLFSFIIIFVWFFNKTFAQVISIGIILHYIIDFLTGETRPFYPYSNEKFRIFSKNKILMIILEIISTIILLGLIVWKM